jgi:hypothetical protein
MLNKSVCVPPQYKYATGFHKVFSEVLQGTSFFGKIVTRSLWIRD